MNPHTPDIDVAVVGGGLAGLTAAATAATAPGPPRRVVLFDPYPLGGRARTDDRNGYTFNRGPRALYLGGPGRPILEALGVDVARGGPPATSHAVGRRDGRLHILPSSTVSALRSSLLTPSEKLKVGRVMRTLVKADPRRYAGTPFTDVVAALGLTGAAAGLVEMLARVATYHADLDVADGEATLTNVQLALGDGVRYLDGGFQTLVDGLAGAALAAGVEVRPIPVDRLASAPDDEGAVLHTVAGALTARTAILAAGTPAWATALLDSPIDGLDRISPPVTAACLELGVRRPPRHPIVFGIGEPMYLSTHSPPARLAPPGHAVVHVMRNHRSDEQLDALAQHAYLRAAAAQAGVADSDIVEERFLRRMIVMGGAPLAAGRGLAGRPAVQDPNRPGVLLAGDWVGDVGLLSDAALASGRAAGLLAAERSVMMLTA